MTVPLHRPALPEPSAHPSEGIQAAAIVAVTALANLAFTRDPTAVPLMVAPVLVALRLRG